MSSDITPPELISIDLSDTLIDMSAGESSFVLTAHLMDDLSGLAPPPYLSVEVRFVSPSGQFVDGSCYTGPVSGDERDGLYEMTVSLGSFAEAGTWTVQSLHLVDAAENHAFLDSGSTPDLATKSFEVINRNADATPRHSCRSISAIL